VPNAELRNQRVDCPELDSRAPAAVAKCSGINVIRAIRRQHRQSGKLRDELVMGLGAAKALQQLLENKPSGDDGVVSGQCGTQCLNLWRRRIGVAPKCKRPYAGVDEQGHRRERSTL